MRARNIFVGLVLICVCNILALAQAPVDKAWQILQQGAVEKSHQKRARAFRALALLGQNHAALQLAEKGLKDESPEVRSAAASALGQMGAKSSIPKLIEMVKDKDASVVFAASDALFRLKDPSAFEVYYAVLLGQRKSGQGLVESQMKMLKDPKALAQLGFEGGIGFIPFASAGYRVFKVVTTDDESPY